MDIVERLRQGEMNPIFGAMMKAPQLQLEAADEIERLRSLLQNGSPIVEATIQHQAIEIMKLKQGVATLNEALTITSQGNAKLKQQVVELREALEVYKGRAILGVSVADEALARTAKEEV